jgi:V/A-type H+-transporting ATPase subunit G/H
MGEFLVFEEASLMESEFSLKGGEYMSLDAIKMVAETEQQNKQKLAEARAKAKQMITEANADGQKASEERQAAAAAEVKRLMQDAELQADKNAKQLLRETELQCAAVRAKAEGRLDAAGKRIVGRIVNN